MHVSVDAFWLPKLGSSNEEYEDAYYPAEPVSERRPSISIAVADGATETSFANTWADLLVRSVCRGGFDQNNLEQQIAKISKHWARLVGKKPLPWFAEEKVRAGAFSSITVVSLSDTRAPAGDDGTWEALAIGDSCLFQVRGEDLITSFPFGKSDQFNNRPVLLSSVPANNAAAWKSASRMAGTWQDGDTFYLMTDALACWLMRGWERRSDPLGFLREIRSQGDFADFVGVQRRDVDEAGLSLLRNDDVTLLRCTLRC